MNSIILLIILIGYLGVLFLIAEWAEKKQNSKWTNNGYVYSLSLAVYCTAWTYYGSIGVAANSGLGYLTIYLGPIIIAPSWILILKKIIRISRVNKISSIADFISLRYGNSRFLGAIVSVVCLVGILPYISLQIKSISETFHLVTKTATKIYILDDNTTYIAVALALFASYYGTKYVDASEKRRGIVTAVALESVLKLVFFLIIGIYVTYFVFDGFDDIYSQASVLKDFQKKNTIGGLPQAINWFLLCVLSMFAIFLLPRQFHVSVVENNRESHINTAVWLFPLYLLLFNIFVYPIAWGGNILFQNQKVNADTYSLLIPQFFNNELVTVMVFLGGFSAAISMVVVSSIGLSTMVTNNILIPYNLLGKLKSPSNAISSSRIVNSRKIGIFMLIITSYLIYRFYVLDYNLMSIGLVAFVIIAQLAPSFFGALYWRRGSRLGAIYGILIGFGICVYSLIIPYIIGLQSTNSDFINNGFLNIELLKPFQLFGLNYLQPVPHALFWSMFFNTMAYFTISIMVESNYRERNYAEMFVDINKYITMHENAFIWKGTAYTSDIQKVLIRFLGAERTTRAMKLFNAKYSIDTNIEFADARLIKFAENLLTGHIGTASSRILISSVVKEEIISLPEVLKILEESKENLIVNKKLIETSNELKNTSDKLQIANNNLMIKDHQKNEFLDTVTHELRTPITAIRASSEILHDDEDLPEDLRKQFLQNIMSESDRLNRLIDKILDLEKFETGKQLLHISENAIYETIHNAVVPLKQLILNKGIIIKITGNQNIITNYDADRIFQVLTNLLGNAIKFCPTQEGKIDINFQLSDQFLVVSVDDNGSGISPNDFENIFNKFYQSENQNFKKPIGSGLGLAISKQIIETHSGNIWVKNNFFGGASFVFQIPQNS